MNIITKHFPKAPYDCNKWMAYDTDKPVKHRKAGWGHTEKDAIADLKERMEEQP